MRSRTRGSTPPINYVRIFRLILISVFVISALFFIYKITGFDILSVNSGGNANITITSSPITENFFPQPNPFSNTCSAQGGIICSSGQTCSGSTVSASDTSFCCVGSCITPVLPPPPGPPSGPPGSIIPTSNISVNPPRINITLIRDTNILQVVAVGNLGANPITININQAGLNNLVIVENTTLTIAPGQIQNLNLIFVAPNQTGVYNGTIHVGDRVIPVTMDVIKQFVLFDSNIIVLNKNDKVPKGELLQTAVTMIPMGENVRMDVNLNYTIKNTNGTVYSTRLETILVTSQQTILRNFGTGGLPYGNYTIDLQLIYPYGVAPSSAHFEVVSTVRSFFSVIAYWMLIMITLIAILIIVLIIIRTVRRLRREVLEEREQNRNEQSVSYL